MKKLSEKQIKKRVNEFMTNMEWAFDYQNFDRSIVFKKDDKPDADCACDVVTDLAYRRVTISVYPCFFEADLKTQRGYLLHEFCHTFSGRLYDMAIDMLNGKFHSHEHMRIANEEATSRITQIVGALLEGRMRYAREGYARYIEVKKPKAKKKK